MMEKDFGGWSKEKEKINALTKIPFFQEREIWFSFFGANVGSEQDGKGNQFLRPIIVVRKFKNDIFWAIPLTHTRKDDEYNFIFWIDLRGENTAILSQIRLMDARRLCYRIGFLSEADFRFLKEKLKALLP
jgi:mRNA interferase MazF